uniref:Uncharacterized protein n=1 Tax=Arundo donax TaxID=35708 RepID=A0A0A9BQD0_ARUDO
MWLSSDPQLLMMPSCCRLRMSNVWHLRRRLFILGTVGSPEHHPCRYLQHHRSQQQGAQWCLHWAPQRACFGFFATSPSYDTG